MPDHTAPAHPKVFVSYSHHDGAEFGQQILALAERLRTDGYDTIIDQYVEGTPPQGWPRWMLNQVDWADYVLLVCTDTYYRRFRGHESGETGKGVDWEGAIITNELYGQKSISTRFVPILFKDADATYIPEPIRGATFYLLTNTGAYERLTDYLAGAAGVQPAPLGLPPNRKRKTGRPIAFGEAPLTNATIATGSRPIPDLSGVPAPGNTMSADDKFYIVRGADKHLTAAACRCETVVIQGPRQFGKSSLLNHYVSACRANNTSVAVVNFARFEQGVLKTYGSFLSALASELARRLRVIGHVGHLRTQARFIGFIESTLLPSIDGQVIFAFDNTDRIMQHAYRHDFFSMLRMWHDHRGDPDLPWHKLGIALVSSTEPMLFISDAFKSPFSVGLRLSVTGFTAEEAAELNRRYGAPLTADDCEELQNLVGGHPFLLQDAYYKLFGPDPISFAELCAVSGQDDGPFGEHLRAMLKNLELKDGLLAALRQIIVDGTAPQQDDFYRLEAAGLVRRMNRQVVPTNRIYSDFFRNAK